MKNVEMYIDSFKMKYESFLIGCDSIEEMGLWDKEALGEMDAFYSNDLTSIIIRLIASDGKITHKEVEYLNKTFGFDYSLQELKYVYESAKDCLEHSFDENFENGISYMRKINTKLANAYKELLSMICEIIINSDGVITHEEIVEIEKLKNICQ